MFKYKNIISFRFLFAVIALSGIFNNIFAQQADNSLDGYGQAAGLFVLLGILVMFILILILGNDKYKDDGTVKAVQKAPAFAKLKYSLTKSVPLDKEADIMLDHDYDGIKELDNKVPPWFNYLFYGTIGIAVVYMLVFHVFHVKPLMLDEYLSELKAAEVQREELIKTGALINEKTVTLLTDVQSLESGKNTFTTNCTPCHGMKGEGTVGPNLTDDNWIHGGGINNIFATIKNGVPAKGMISWQSLLNPKKIQEVASYVISLHGTNPPNGKPPEGEKYVPQDSVKTNVKTDTVKSNIKTDTLKTEIKKDSVKADTTRKVK
jgi:cytochrome c oxidase cbb3-type subunit 3